MPKSKIQNDIQDPRVTVSGVKLGFDNRRSGGDTLLTSRPTKGGTQETHMETNQPENILILASASPRRRQLLTEAGYRFDVRPSQIDESAYGDAKRDPETLAIDVAVAKARDVARQITVPAVVLGADTIVACDGDVLGKASDADEARRMLFRLARTRHRVITGIALIHSPSGREILKADTAWITMRPMTEKEIEDYIASGSWIDKAGAYAVQEGADKFIVHIDGSFTNVVGLPMELVQNMLAQMGIHPARMHFP